MLRNSNLRFAGRRQRGVERREIENAAQVDGLSKPRDVACAASAVSDDASGSSVKVIS